MVLRFAKVSVNQCKLILADESFGQNGFSSTVGLKKRLRLSPTLSLVLLILIFLIILSWGVFRPCAHSVCAPSERKVEFTDMHEPELIFGEEVVVADYPVELVSSDIAAAKIDDQTERQPGTGRMPVSGTTSS